MTLKYIFVCFIATCLSACRNTTTADETAHVPVRLADDSPLVEKAAWFQQNLIEKHWLDGLYVSITPTAPNGVHLKLKVDTSGNVIHSEVWTGRYCGFLKK